MGKSTAFAESCKRGSWKGKAMDLAFLRARILREALQEIGAKNPISIAGIGNDGKGARIELRMADAAEVQAELALERSTPELLEKKKPGRHVAYLFFALSFICFAFVIIMIVQV